LGNTFGQLLARNNYGTKTVDNCQPGNCKRTTTSTPQFIDLSRDELITKA